jgi:hypothetical protein
MKKVLALILLIYYCYPTIGQTITGTLINAESRQPVEFANIGIAGKNTGTVSDHQGKFSLTVDDKFDNDTILFSIIGFKTRHIAVADLRKQNDYTVLLEEKIYELSEVVVKPKVFKPRTLGVTSRFKGVSAGFKDNLLGYELGIRVSIKKTAFLKAVNINIARCTYDTIFYRMNIYKVHGDMDFENILQEPIYIQMTKESVKDQIQIDLQSKNIVVDGDFLITLEHVKNLGNGTLYFCARFPNKTYFRKTSHGNWETAPIGISMSVIADVEK